MKCNHDYMLIQTDRIDPPILSSVDKGLTKFEWSGEPWMLDTKIILTFKCKLCADIWISEHTGRHAGGAK